MSDVISETLTVSLTPSQAFALFAEQLGDWWPREYTWGQDALQAIGIEPRVNGLCYELGPHGFRCDWGRVLAWEPASRLVLAWQISPRREPEPNPARASTVEVYFASRESGGTLLTLRHHGFECHGDGAEEYRAALASPQGWPYILERFAAVAG